MILKIFLCIILVYMTVYKSEEHTLEVTNYFMKMLGGNEANIKEYPYVVFISVRNTALLCTGTIITPELILSAAHCFCNTSNDCYRLEEGKLYSY